MFVWGCKGFRVSGLRVCQEPTSRDLKPHTRNFNNQPYTLLKVEMDRRLFRGLNPNP